MTDADDSVRERIADDPFCETLGIELASLEPGAPRRRSPSRCDT
jgi:acyl-CoA thioesterase